MTTKTLAIAVLTATTLAGAAQAQMFGPQPQQFMFHYQPIAPAPQPVFPTVPMAPVARPLFTPPPPPPGPQPMLVTPIYPGTGGYR